MAIICDITVQAPALGQMQLQPTIIFGSMVLIFLQVI